MKLIPVTPRRATMFSRDGNRLLKEIDANAGSQSEVKDGFIQVEGEGGSEYFAEQVINAICFGFEPKIAFKLFKDDFFLEIIDLSQVISRNKKKLAQQRARLIGTQGQAKATLEELSGALISIMGNKVALIGGYEELKNAKEAIRKLLEGNTHLSVFAFLERKQHRVGKGL